MKVSKIALLVAFSVVSATAHPGEAFSADRQNENSTIEPLVQGADLVIAEGLSDFQWFRIFPYVDKSHTLAAAGRTEDAIVEVQRARQIVPEHLPLILHHVELLIKSDDPQRALEVLEPHLENTEARRVYATLLGRSDRIARLSEEQFFAELDRLETDQQAAFASGYLAAQGASLSKSQLIRLTESLNQDQLHAELSAQVAEYLFRRGATEEVVGLLKPLCRTESDRAGRGNDVHCSDLQRSQLIQAMVLSGQFSGIEQLLMPLSEGDFDTMLETTASRMIGAERTDELINLLTNIDERRPLRDEWGLVLYRLAVDSDQTTLALALADRYSVNCLSHTELLLREQQLERASERLQRCQPSASDESRYLVLAQQIGEPELLEDVQLSSSEGQRTRVNLLVDHYSQNNQRGDLIRTLERYDAMSPEMALRLAQAYYENGQPDQALSLTERGWRQRRETAALDYHTYVLLNEERYEDLLHIAVSDKWDVESARFGDVEVTERVSIGIERASSVVSSEDLVNAAQRWPDRRVATQISEVLIQRQNCRSAMAIRPQLQGRAGYQVDSYCLSTPASRLVALEQYRAEWGDDEWLRGAVLAYESSHYSKSLEYLDNLSGAVERGTYKPLELSALLASGKEDTAWAKWLELRNPLSEDEMIIGVEIAMRRDDRESVITALQRVEDSQSPRTGLPLRLRLAEIDDDLEQQLSLFEQMAEENPEDSYYSLAQAYVQQRLGHHGASGLIFEQVFASYPQTRNAANLRQAAYVNAQARRDDLARQQLRDVIDIGVDLGQQGTELHAQDQRFYRDVASPFQVSVAGWVGESTSVSQVTGNDFQADYFFSSIIEYDLDYGRERRTNLSLFANLLSAGDNFFFDSNNLDIGMAWQPIETHQSFLRVAGRASLDGDDMRLYVRGSTDLLASHNREKNWAENRRVVDHSLYLDWLFFPDESSSSFYARYQPTFQFAGAQRSYFRLAAYPFIQYQWTNDTFDEERLTDTRVGLGVTLRHPVGSNRYSGWRAFSEVGLEWQHVVDSQIAGVSDDALLLRFVVYF